MICSESEKKPNKIGIDRNNAHDVQYQKILYCANAHPPEATCAEHVLQYQKLLYCADVHPPEAICVEHAKKMYEHNFLK